MKIHIILLSVLLLLGSVQKVSSQINENSDTTLYDFSAIQQQDIFLDSMLTRWYVKKSLNNKIEDYTLFDSIITDVSDSVYLERLQKLTSPIQMTYNEDVKNWINIYIKKNRRTPAIIGLMEYYSPIFEEVLDAKGLPLEFRYLPIIESALNPRALSRAGASGLWQFIYSTGKMYDLEINSYIDQRMDPIASTHAAAQFISDMYAVYGDWTLVLAAYNCGPGNVNKAIKRAKQKTDFWEIYQYLPRETRGYVPAFIAASYTMNYYKDHNIRPLTIEMNMNTDTVMIHQKLHLIQVADVLGMSIDEIRDLNPQYKKDIIPANAGAYSLRLPIEKCLDFIELEDSIYNYNDSILLGKVQNAKMTADASKNTEKTKKEKRTYSNSYATSSYSSRTDYTPPTTEGKKKVTYNVKQGDNYGFIASWYNVSVADIKYWNNTYNNKLSINQELTIYVPIKKFNYYAQVNSLSFDEKQNRKGQISTSSTTSVATKSAGLSTNSASNSNKELSNEYVWHKIRSGENLWLIAQQYDGVTDKDIRNLNGLSYTDLKKLKTGQYIKVKRKSK